jgi:hypothetical protein
MLPVGCSSKKVPKETARAFDWQNRDVLAKFEVQFFVRGSFVGCFLAWVGASGNEKLLKLF